MKNSHKVFFGYYTGTHRRLLCIAKEKDIVMNYLQNHRGLQKKEFQIEKSYLSDTEIVSKYENYVISEYNGYYIPYIDQLYIELHGKTMSDEIQELIRSMCRIITLSKDIKKIPREDISVLMKATNILVAFRKEPKVLSKLTKNDQLYNSILYCPIHEYISSITTLEEMMNMDQTFKDTWLS